MVNRPGGFHESRLFQLSMVQTFQDVPIKFILHRHQCLCPSLVEHLQVVVATLSKIVHANGSTLNFVDIGDGGDLVAICLPVNSGSPCFSCQSSATWTFLLNSMLMIFMTPCAIWESRVSKLIRALLNTNPASSQSCIEVAMSNSDNQSVTCGEKREPVTTFPFGMMISYV